MAAATEAEQTGSGHGANGHADAGIKQNDDPASFWASLQEDSKDGEGSGSSSRSSSPGPSTHGKRSPRSHSRSESVAVKGGSTPRNMGGRPKAKKEVVPPPLIDQLPVAWEEAHETFEVLEKCVYETKKLGLSREQDEMMICDCMFDKRHPDAEQCGPHSDCVNRAIFIECLPHECRAKGQCRNQRFSKRHFANVEIVQTEMKGYGLRAALDISAGTLIYEYIGEVVGENKFRQRMAAYGEEGIKHFYFMMLQKEEYIDATKKGGIGRFANHSCNPNCEVQKWVVGRRLRMGIFAKRDVFHGEEITFNYNVDRYGHEAQICYCGEPNCVGYIGGKTQTDIGGINDLFLDALGISDQVEAEGMKGSKKKKARHLDEDFTPILKPIVEPEVQKVAAAIRQSMENKRIMRMLLDRVKMTEDGAIHRQLIRMHGFSLMFMIFTELSEERELVLLALQGMSKWNLQYRNKIEDSNIEEPVKLLQGGDDKELSTLAQKLLDQWSSLELSYKIPRVSKIASLDADDDADTTTIADAKAYSYPDLRKPQAWENTATIQFTVAPVKFRPPSAFVRPVRPPPPVITKSGSIISHDRLKLDAIIAMAQQTPAPPAPPTPGATGFNSPAASQAESSRSFNRRDDEDDDRKKRAKTGHQGSDGYLGSYGGEEDEAAKKEKKLMKLVGEVVVRSMSKYKEMMDHETFKKYARDCTHTLVEKEKRSATYQAHRNATLSEEKKAKIKSFTKEFTHKLLKRLKEKGKLKKPSGSSSHKSKNGGGSSALSTPTAITASTPTTTTSLLETPRTQSADDTADDFDDIFGGDHLGSLDDINMGIDVDAELELADTDLTPLALPKFQARTSWADRRVYTQPEDIGDDINLDLSPVIQPVDRWSASTVASKANGISFNAKGDAGEGNTDGYMNDEGRETPLRTPTSS